MFALQRDEPKLARWENEKLFKNMRNSLHLHHFSCHNLDSCRWVAALPISWHIVHTFCSTFDNSGNFSVAGPSCTTDTIANSNSPTTNSYRIDRLPMVDEYNWHLCIRHPDSMDRCQPIWREYDQLKWFKRKLSQIFRVKLSIAIGCLCVESDTYMVKCSCNDSYCDSQYDVPLYARTCDDIPAAAMIQTLPRSHPIQEEQFRVEYCPKISVDFMVPSIYLAIAVDAVLLLQLFDTCIDASCCDPCCIEWLTQMHNRSACFHHRIPFVVFDQFAQCRKLLTTSDIVFIVLPSDHDVRYFVVRPHW